jgi:phospholipid/cholesterol/gamma-HCH transport system substrate-binding protein
MSLGRLREQNTGSAETGIECDMRRNLIETLMGAVVLAVAVLFVVFAYNTADLGGGSGQYPLYAEFNRVGSLKPGSDVRMSGIKIGTVTSQQLDTETYLAKVTFGIRDGISLPADSSASVASEGLLGGNFLDLTPGGAEDMLKPGDRVQYTQDAIDIIQLLGKFIFSAGDSASNSGGS